MGLGASVGERDYHSPAGRNSVCVCFIRSSVHSPLVTWQLDDFVLQCVGPGIPVPSQCLLCRGTLMGTIFVLFQVAQVFQMPSSSLSTARNCFLFLPVGEHSKDRLYWNLSCWRWAHFDLHAGRIGFLFCKAPRPYCVPPIPMVLRILFVFHWTVCLFLTHLRRFFIFWTVTQHSYELCMSSLCIYDLFSFFLLFLWCPLMYRTLFILKWSQLSLSQWWCKLLIPYLKWLSVEVIEIFCCKFS